MSAALPRQAPPAARPARSPTPRALDGFVANALEAALRERALVQVTLPAPATRDPHGSLRYLLRSCSASFTPPDGNRQLAHGSAVTLGATGQDRFAAVEAARHALFARCVRHRHPDAPFDRAPRLYGGFAFAPGSADEDPWGELGDARFFLPRFAMESGSLFVSVDLRDGNPQRIEMARAELLRVFEALRAPGASAPSAPSGEREADRDAYRAWFARIHDAIERGDVEKVVAARRQVLFAERAIDPWTVLDRLAESHPSTFRVGLRFGRSTLLAASPERLFQKRGRTLSLDALAGTIDARRSDAAAALAASDKDRREHRLVVEHLAARLGPLAVTLDAPARPQLRRLPDVWHLHTPMAATLREGIEPERLVAALHPTPAVAGAPNDVAAALIAAHEPTPRGWYCGPVGWIDADGDAELAMALRCGLVRGSTAWLYAGGGIVRGSTEEAEWHEASWKLRPMRRALGAPGD